MGKTSKRSYKPLSGALDTMRPDGLEALIIIGKYNIIYFISANCKGFLAW